MRKLSSVILGLVIVFTQNIAAQAENFFYLSGRISFPGEFNNCGIQQFNGTIATSHVDPKSTFLTSGPNLQISPDGTFSGPIQEGSGFANLNLVYRVCSEERPNVGFDENITWVKPFNLTADLKLNFDFPKKVLSNKFVIADAQGNPIKGFLKFDNGDSSRYVLTWIEEVKKYSTFKQKPDFIGDSKYIFNTFESAQKTGQSLYLDSIPFGQDSIIANSYNVTASTLGGSSAVTKIVSAIQIDNREIKLCLPVNIGSGGTFSPECYDDSALKALIDNYSQQQIAKSKASEQKQVASSPQTKKSTIVCVKGKLSKIVTALKPSCPLGFKKK